MRYLFILVFFFPAILQGQTISTFAGSGSSTDSGDGGPAIIAGINRPYGAVFDKNGNLLTVQVNTHRVRKISSAGVITTIAGTGTAGFSGDGGLAVNAEINSPRWVDVDERGNIYIADGNNYRIRKIDTNGVINTVAGNGTSGYNGEGIAATSASMILPSGIDVDSIGNIYVCENSRIRKIDTFGIITTIIGTGTSGFSGDGGLAAAAQIQAGRIYIDPYGNFVVVDYYRIRKVDASTGIISTIAGTGLGNYNGDEIPALTANMNAVALAWDKQGNLHVADMGNDRVRMISSDSIIHTVAGTGVAGYSGDGGLATLAEMYDPTGVAFDTCGNLYIPCKENHNIRKVTYNDSCGQLSTKTVTSANNAISIYPNPITTLINIKSGNKIRQASLHNAVGQLVLTQVINKEEAQINIEDLQPGVYLLILCDESGARTTKKIIKE